jgi:hypothetical protein
MSMFATGTHLDATVRIPVLEPLLQFVAIMA